MSRFYFLFILLPFIAQAQKNSFGGKNIRAAYGVLYSKENKVQDGYTLFCPTTTNKTFLVNNKGRVINVWTSDYLPGQTAYLLKDGSLIRTCKSNNGTFKIAGIGGKLEKKDWNNNLLWEWELNDTTKCLHHDIIPLPNGNILALLVERKFIKDVIDCGRDTSRLTEKELWPESIIEIKPKGKNDAEIVWQWSAWEHLTQNKFPDRKNYNPKTEEHPELIDVNFNLDLNSSADFLHTNSIDFNPELNQILISVRNFHEIWIIDHSTTTSEAKGHLGGACGKGGDILYRWGNPKAYNINEDAKLDGQHGAAWIKKGYVNEGKITIFDNKGSTRNSRVIVVETPLNPSKTGYTFNAGQSFLPKEEFWTYSQKGLQEGRGCNLAGLKNGNLIFCETSRGKFTEVTLAKDTAWIYACPVSSEGVATQSVAAKGNQAVFKVEKYPIDHPAFKGRKIIPGGTLELNPFICKDQMVITPEMQTQKEITYSLKSNPYFEVAQLKLNVEDYITVFDTNGIAYDKQLLQPKSKWYIGLYKKGIYYFSYRNTLLKINIVD